jgi:hypothetical protein
MAGIKKYVTPPPEFPQPPIKEFAVPTIFLSKNPVDQTWHGTNDPPRIPTKKRSAMRPPAEFTVPAKAVGIAPIKSTVQNVQRGPNLSHIGPAMVRTMRVPAIATMLELAISTVERWRSFLMVMLRSGGKAYLIRVSRW